MANRWTKDNAILLRINGNKTKEMIICFCRNSDHVNDIPNIRIDGIEIERVEHVKALGVTITSNLTWNKRVESIVAKAAKRVYILHRLKRCGVSQGDLVKIYLSVIRPVWHSHLPKYLSDSIETIQNRALRCVYPGKVYNDILASLNLNILAQRRDMICRQYFNKIKSSSHKLYELLPPYRELGHDLRSHNVYPLIKARTNRYSQSFIPWSLRNCQ